MNIIIGIILVSIMFGFIFAHKSSKITWGEFWVMTVISIVTAIGLYTSFYYSKISDYKFVNDYVTNVKYIPHWVSEDTCYRTVCSGSGKNESCHSVPYTCYHDHGNKYEYLVSDDKNNWDRFKNMSHSEFFKIKDECTEPVSVRGYRPNYYSGDRNDYMRTNKDNIIIPWTDHIHWKNKIKASKNIIKYHIDNIKNIKDYPNKYTPNLLKYNKVIGIDNDILNYRMISEWNSLLKNVNIIVYGFKNGGYVDCENLSNKWIGGKQNDIIFCVIYNDSNKITGFKAISWIENKELLENLNSIYLNKYIKDIPSLKDKTISLIKSKWVENNFKEYNYLNIEFTVWDFILIFIIYGIINSIGWVICYNNDIIDENEKNIF